MNRPKLLDLYCCEGGAGVGYERAGFDVYGVDINPQPLYPYPIAITDAVEHVHRLMTRDAPFKHKDGRVEWLTIDDFAAIHASPPCQAHSTITPDKSKHLNLIPATRDALADTGLPYIIENVEGARTELINPVRLCGSSFGMKVRRHRWFESNVPLLALPCDHASQGAPVGVYGQHGDASGAVPRPDGTSRGKKAADVHEAREVMGMPWASWRGCAQAIPPAYSEFLGGQLIDALVTA